MCGFCGFLDLRRDQPEDVQLTRVTAMADRIRHRGPDGSGTWVDAETGLALGHRRLAVIDLSVQGHQPMHSASGRWVTVYNGEVYNFEAIRAELAGAGGAAWRGHSDTEVILAAVERWGVASAFERFNGMFALALWDRQERILWLARDRAGEKPLYYGWSGGVFFFGSELKAFAGHPAWAPQLDRGAMALFLRHNYIPAPYSAYIGIRKLTPGSLLRLDANNDHTGTLPAPVPFWDVTARERASRASPFVGSAVDAVEELDALLRDAVRLRMVSDVPLGAFLSGGIDSSTVVALMQAQSSRPVRTFSIGFNEEGYNEAQHAAAVAQHLGTEHTELYVTSQQARDVIPMLSTMYDEPFADSSQIPTFLVSQLARRHVTVSLSGDAGDELFGGYNRYAQGEALWRKISMAPRAVRRVVAAGLTSVSATRWNAAAGAMGGVLPRRLRRPDMGRLLHKVAPLLASGSAEAFYRGLVSHEQFPERLVHAPEPPTWLTEPGRWPSAGSMTERMMFLDLVTYLPDDILVKVDRASMAVSLEGRIPMLDHRVIEFAWRLPLALKVRGLEGKWVLRQVLDRYVPRRIMERPKMGFGVPLGQWLRGPLRDWAEELLSKRSLAAAGVIDPAPVREVWHSHLSGRTDAQYWLWNVLMLQSWCRTTNLGHTAG